MGFASARESEQRLAAEKAKARSFLGVPWLHQVLGGLTDEAIEVGSFESLKKWALLSLEMRLLTLACIHVARLGILEDMAF